MKIIHINDIFFIFIAINRCTFNRATNEYDQDNFMDSFIEQPHQQYLMQPATRPQNEIRKKIKRELKLISLHNAIQSRGKDQPHYSRKSQTPGPLHNNSIITQNISKMRTDIKTKNSYPILSQNYNHVEITFKNETQPNKQSSTVCDLTDSRTQPNLNTLSLFSGTSSHNYKFFNDNKHLISRKRLLAPLDIDYSFLYNYRPKTVIVDDILQKVKFCAEMCDRTEETYEFDFLSVLLFRIGNNDKKLTNFFVIHLNNMTKKDPYLGFTTGEDAFIYEKLVKPISISNNSIDLKHNLCSLGSSTPFCINEHIKYYKAKMPLRQLQTYFRQLNYQYHAINIHEQFLEQKIDCDEIIEKCYKIIKLKIDRSMRYLLVLVFSELSTATNVFKITSEILKKENHTLLQLCVFIKNDIFSMLNDHIKSVCWKIITCPGFQVFLTRTHPFFKVLSDNNYFRFFFAIWTTGFHQKLLIYYFFHSTLSKGIRLLENEVRIDSFFEIFWIDEAFYFLVNCQCFTTYGMFTAGIRQYFLCLILPNHYKVEEKASIDSLHTQLEYLLLFEQPFRRLLYNYFVDLMDKDYEHVNIVYNIIYITKEKTSDQILHLSEISFQLFNKWFNDRPELVLIE